ncbi:prolipoprotein diacylglyceryl transferase [Chitinophaga pendula]|uniref:prolipoprotein diacylglyceryl transferase n=1 Tax=Chitinophaga TaxID=79328 RepID=UPI000BAEBA48|nr:MULTISPECIES: prolipoprotein diacylglyceryl transferase family protein [Chitinophaga]ASZ13970.1 diacylglyceryl transferase [Chitinophaga sp. MD30]UCJ08407.1 prolipoprotein diacylglyceryl transferase [Chitinophaga pendula]
MYPNLYYAFKDLFGLEIPFLQVFQTFGFFVAVAFLAGAYVLTAELKRREKLGWLTGVKEQIITGKPASTTELVWNAFLGFLLGFKIIGLALNWSNASKDLQSFIFSGAGSWPAGILLGALLAYLKYREKKKQATPQPQQHTVIILPHQRVPDIIVMAAVAGLIGAKIFHNLENWSDFVKDPIGSLLSFSGLTFYGGLIVAAYVIIRYARKKQINTWQLVDSAAPALMLAYGIGRMGCQFSGDGDWGITNTHPNPYSWLPDWAWAYKYPHNVVNEGIPIPGCEGKYCHALELPVYPTPLYEIIACLLLFIILWNLRKKITVPGVIFGIYLIMNGIERFFVEKIRVNTKYDILGFHPTQAEIISTLLVIGGAALIWYCRKKHASQTATS